MISLFSGAVQAAGRLVRSGSRRDRLVRRPVEDVHAADADRPSVDGDARPDQPSHRPDQRIDTRV